MGFGSRDSLRGSAGAIEPHSAQAGLHRNENLMFHSIDSDQLLAYSKRTADSSNVVLVVVNLDPRQAHSGWVELPLDQWHLNGGTFEVVDLLRDQKFSGRDRGLTLSWIRTAGHVFQVRR